MGTEKVQTVQKRSYSVEEVAAMFGLSADFIYQAIRHGEMSVTRAGRRLLIPVAEVEAWEKRNTAQWVEAHQS